MKTTLVIILLALILLVSCNNSPDLKNTTWKLNKVEYIGTDGLTYLDEDFEEYPVYWLFMENNIMKSVNYGDTTSGFWEYKDGVIKTHGKLAGRYFILQNSSKELNLKSDPEYGINNTLYFSRK